MKIQGIITKITKQHIGARTIFNVQLDSKSAKELNKGTIECVYFNSKLNLYMPVQLEGEIKNDKFNVTELKAYFSRADQVIRFMMHKIRGCGLGQKRIESIVDQFGSSIFDMTKNEFKERLESNFKGRISEKTICSFLDVWYSESSISELEEFLGTYEIKYSSLEKINEEYNNEAVKKFKEDPYQECIKFDIKRQVAEQIAHKLKIDKFDKRRIAGLISYTLIAAGNDGHTYLQAPEIAGRINKFSLKSPYRTKIPLACVANEITTNKAFYLDTNKGFVSFTATHNDEINSALRLKRINKEYKSNIVIQDSEIEKIEKVLNFKFAQKQKGAFKMLESGGVNILTGGPGTGKTTIIKGIILYFTKMNPGKTVLLCAPTGRAAKRLSESTGFEAKTIHKLLEFKPFQEVEAERNNNNPLEADMIVVDETSMCDTYMLNMLLNAIPKNCLIIFVGDENQLPSVGAGNCLHDMINSNLFGVYRLTENFRSEGSIIENANKVLNGELPNKSYDFEIKKASTEQQAFTIVSDLMEEYYKQEDPFYSQIIEPSRKGPAGCDAINSKAHKMVHKNLGDNVSEDLMVGDKIMFIRNEYKSVKSDDGDIESVPLYTNGEIVTIQSLDEEDVTIYDGYEERILKRSVLNDARLCYAYTIHKSQGSENNVIIIYLSGDNNVKCMMNRNLLYTAITRAKKKVILVYTGDALESCIKNEYFVQRNTRLLEHLLAL